MVLDRVRHPINDDDHNKMKCNKNIIQTFHLRQDCDNIFSVINLGGKFTNVRHGSTEIGSPTLVLCLA